MRRQLSKRNIKELNLPYKRIEEEKTSNNTFLICDGTKCFFKYDKDWVPTLKYVLKKNDLPKVTINMGAIPFIANGADVMRPGIVEVNEFSKNTYVVIIDEKNKKPLAIGKTMFESKKIREMEKGKVIKTIHYVGDKIWSDN